MPAAVPPRRFSQIAGNARMAARDVPCRGIPPLATLLPLSLISEVIAWARCIAADRGLRKHFVLLSKVSGNGQKTGMSSRSFLLVPCQTQFSIVCIKEGK